MVCDRIAIVEHDLLLLDTVFDLVPFFREGDGWEDVTVFGFRGL